MQEPEELLYRFRIRLPSGQTFDFWGDRNEFTVEVNNIPMCGVLRSTPAGELWIGYYRRGEEWQVLAPVEEEPEGIPTGEQPLPPSIVQEVQQTDLTEIHKATPGTDDGYWSIHCRFCGQQIRRVPGGQGTTWIHTDSGAVAAPGDRTQRGGPAGPLVAGGSWTDPQVDDSDPEESLDAPRDDPNR